MDSIDQLLRRLSLVLEMDDSSINLMEYNPTQTAYRPMPGTSRPNPYSKASRPTPITTPFELYASMFADGNDSPQTDEGTAPTE